MEESISGAGVPEYPPRRIPQQRSPEIRSGSGVRAATISPGLDSSSFGALTKKPINPLRKSDSFSITSDPVYDTIEIANICIKTLSVDIDSSFEPEYAEFKDTIILAKKYYCFFKFKFKFLLLILSLLLHSQHQLCLLILFFFFILAWSLLFFQTRCMILFSTCACNRFETPSRAAINLLMCLLVLRGQLA